MLKALKELGEFALGLVSDCVEFLWVLQVPVVASSTHGPDRMRALQLSVFVGIVLLIVWGATAQAGDSQLSAVSAGVIAALYISFSAWIMNAFLSRRGLYVATSEVKSDALTIVLAFNFIVILLATVVREFDLYIFRHRPFGLERWDASQTQLVTMTLPVFVALALATSNSLRYRWAHGASERTRYADIAFFALLNTFLSAGFVYLIYIIALALPK